MSPRVVRAALVILLIGGAYLAALRWTACAFPLGPRLYPEMWRVCAFGSGDPVFDRGGPGPLWPNLVFAAIYLLAALYVARARIAIGASSSDRTGP